MARYIGPKSRISRRFGEAIFGPDKVLSKRNYPAGQHGNNRRKKSSEYGQMLAEKQKAKYTYGVLERQFRNLFEKASSKTGVTGEILLQLLEARLDNVVYRLGIAPTRAAARQLVRSLLYVRRLSLSRLSQMHWLDSTIASIHGLSGTLM